MEVKVYGNSGDEEWVPMREKMEDWVEIEGEDLWHTNFDKFFFNFEEFFNSDKFFFNFEVFFNFDKFFFNFEEFFDFQI
ncbi:hypothetical protein BVRB_1g021050 [Beta vulgaris subsp. vulgaris]|nr:hypothetical protein BVRB_1g021050 [Beta vulgaris subsp. vulgaris]